MNDRDTPQDAINDLFNDFDTVSRAPQKTEPTSSSPPKPGRRGKPTFRSGLNESQTDRRQTAQAVGKKATVAGQYIRRSFTFRPEQLERIEQMSAMLGLSQNDLIRWFTDMGVESVEQGVRPPVADEIRHRYDPGG